MITLLLLCNIGHIFKNSVKLQIFPRKFGWSILMTYFFYVTLRFPETLLGDL